nr:hypothetical protein Itr_chr11CG20670 [Ipomoea trifida]
MGHAQLLRDVPSHLSASLMHARACMPPSTHVRHTPQPGHAHHVAHSPIGPNPTSIFLSQRIRHHPLLARLYPQPPCTRPSPPPACTAYPNRHGTYPVATAMHPSFLGSCLLVSMHAANVTCLPSPTRFEPNLFP